MRIATYNLGCGAARRPLRPEVLGPALAELRPDLVALQEVLDPGTPGAAGVDGLARELGLQPVFAGNFVGPRGVLGNALLSSRPITDFDNLDVSWPRRERRGILRARLEAFDVYNVHFGLRQRERERQWHRMLEWVADSSRSLVICGDFNDWSGALERRAKLAGLTNALTRSAPRMRKTFSARWPLFALDRIYLRGLVATAARVLRGQPWRSLSDHLPVFAELQVPDGGKEP